MTRITDELLESLDVAQIRSLNTQTYLLAARLRELHSYLHEQFIASSHQANKLVREVEPPRPDPVLCEDAVLPCYTYSRSDEMASFVAETEVLLARQDFHSLFLRVRVLIFDRLGFEIMTDNEHLFRELAQVHDQAQRISIYLDSIAGSRPMKASAARA